MWDGLLVLVLLCIVMASASFLVGSLPLSLTLSVRQLRLITALGTGVLVGTALIVIIPEGVETLYSAEGSSHSHEARALYRRSQDIECTWMRQPLNERAAVPAIDLGVPSTPEPDMAHILNAPGPILNDIKIGSPTSSATHKLYYSQASDDEDAVDDSSSRPDSTENHDPHAYVGLSVILGFILMYLIDNLPRHMTQSSRPRRFQINLNSFSFNRTPTAPSEGSDAANNPDDYSNSDGNAKSSSTTVGLVIHAAADGIALGASSVSKSNLGFIVFIALMVHKAPAAFGLTSVLLKQGLSKRAARAHLIVFSLAAPVGALLTWAAANIFGYRSLAGDASTDFITGILLLFSGGTFLYVAMHTMQEGATDHNESHSNGYADVPMGVYETQQPKSSTGEGLTTVIVTVVGMLLPLLTQFGHAH